MEYYLCVVFWRLLVNNISFNHKRNCYVKDKEERLYEKRKLKQFVSAVASDIDFMQQQYVFETLVAKLRKG